MNSRRSTDRSVATRVVMSYRAVDADEGDWPVADSDWLRDAVEKSTFRTYQKRAHGGSIAVGDEFEEFVNCGCASPQDVVLRVEEVVEGTALGKETEIEMRPRRDFVGTASNQ